MRIEDLLRDDEASILDEAWHAVARLEHYHRDGDEETRRRVKALYAHVVRAVSTRDLRGLLAHATRVARERAAAGYDFSEVQAAFAILEEAIRRDALERLPESEQAWGLGLVGTALAHGKDALGKTYAALSPRPPALDLTSLFSNADALEQRPAEDLVFPV
jgi:hypothetical protein